MMKAFLFATAALCLPMTAHAAEVVPFYGTFGAAYGDYKVGDWFKGELSYNLEYNEFDENGNISLATGTISLTFRTRLTAHEAPVIYASYDTGDQRFSVAGARSMPLLRFSIDDVTANPNYLPTLAQLTGKQGWLSFDDVYAVPVGDDFESVYLGGEGTLRIGVAAVPEPASWTMMIAGFGAIGCTLRRRARTRTRVTFA